jgi:peptidoglycan/xylan/chitin deacetylase (PgdA/CDA1 family)
MQTFSAKQLAFKLMSAPICSDLLWRACGSGLRILVYHGVARDELAGQKWLPSYFATQSVFDRQLFYLKQNANVLKLSDAIRLLRSNRLPDRAVCITFDDGYANNLHIALPILKKYEMPVTIFLSTAYIESGEFFPFDRLRLLQSFDGSAHISMNEYRNQPLDEFFRKHQPPWIEYVRQLGGEVLEALRPLTVQEVHQFPEDLVDFGAHSHTHCIFSNESRERRVYEISHSVELVQAWSGKPVFCFSFPNGEAGDFDELDKSVLRANGVQAAVTALLGRNHPDVDVLELRRQPVGGPDVDLRAFVARLIALRECIQLTRAVGLTRSRAVEA